MHVLKKNNRTRIFKRFCWLLEFANLQLHHFSRLALFQFLHQNIIAGIEIMRVGWHQKARLKHHLVIAGPGARPSHPTMGTKTKWMSFWKWTANTMATLTYIKWTRFIPLSILSFQHFVLRSLCSMKVSHPTTACFGMLDVHCHESEDRIAWLCQ